MNNTNNWQRLLINACRCGCGELVAKNFKKGHGRRRPLGARLAARLRQTGDCVEWTGAISTGGYGRIGIDGRRTGQAHRVAYELVVGPIPDGLQLDHLCRNRRCVLPQHLEPVAQAENIRRANSVRWHGFTSPLGDPGALLTAHDLAALLTGERP